MEDVYIQIPFVPGGGGGSAWTLTLLYANGLGNSSGGVSGSFDSSGYDMLFGFVPFYKPTSSETNPVIDNKGNTLNFSASYNANNAGVKCFWIFPGTFGSGHTISAQDHSYVWLVVIGITCAGSAAYDQEDGFNDTLTPPDDTIKPGALTPGAGDALIFCGLDNLTDGATTQLIDSGFTILSQTPFVGGTNMAAALAYKIVPVASLSDPEFTLGVGGTAGSFQIIFLP